ncbi:MAG: ABC transporter ATP-binding protein [Lysobacteraceae bacterium SCN 69-123]|uniref:ATP-binding cassette domain-containing protein n=1 Tax=Stenotrophomonas acidaminiphila TaxID=128780 RepID=UPI00086A7D64|nr:ATP-binding cassette domain-containing protein [Stenotrophomonas acidaminiphila]MBN8800819.1 ATP-binding cassette domain-containing protein [Stenotrophomonas acidaminiphila]MDF9442633.1 ATP-binding cassette domain-containing protein [Stenotrophomonas acidaminiphila]ODU42357.1 MAG: ABC transporter ATP-binding protein [Xanthomonadaceae bacterium SCN 69-123]OJY80379.1 MAG: ABC transporter ATP-binding protein [Stenotrophomonas sp. 69-14]
MPLITLQNVDYSVGGPLLLEKAELSIESGERIALIGRNGAGKSTLMKLMAGELKPDDGEVRVQQGVRVTRLEQEVPHGASGSVFDVVADGLGELGHWLAEFHRLSHAETFDGDAMGKVQARIDAADGWALDQRVSETLTKLELDGDAEFGRLSGGMKRRVLLARALVAGPDVLLLDEPTNHLDIEAIDWLEGFLKGWNGCVVFVTHDRRFLRALATRIVEIDRGQVTSWPGDWDNYERRREERLNAQAQENARFDKLLAQEEVWIRQGIKARRTRDEGRVRRLKAMRMERGQRRELGGNVRLEAAAGENSGKKVIDVKDVSFAFGERVMIRDFSTTIMRGDRIGLIGPNGSGKTTLLKLLLGELQPDRGEVRQGTNLQIAYFDQYRATLREDWSAIENVAEGADFIDLNGKRKHVHAYLQDFLFTPERARAPITRLSGGERNRLLLAKLFAQPSNLLVMDEPTNDLDVETLELLEELLGDYTGTLLLVSHDRDFLDNVVTSTLVLEGEGRVGDYVGGYTDSLRQRPPPAQNGMAVASATAVPAAKPVAAAAVAEAAPARRKLSFKDARELEQLPAKIEQLERDVEGLTGAMNDPAFYTRSSAEVTAHTQQLARVQAELDAAYARWEELDG